MAETSTLPAGDQYPRLGLPALDIKTESPDDLTCWSVTTIIGVLDKPALQYWAAEMTAIAAVGSQATWRGMLDDCDDGCPHDSAACPSVKWLRDARFRRPRNRLASTDLGTVVHALAESYALTGVRPDGDMVGQEIRTVGGPQIVVELEAPVVAAMLDGFDRWLQRFQPAYEATEVAVFSPRYGYAGTTDGFLVVDGTRFIVDYKTTREPRDSNGAAKKPYPEVALQLAAYRYAELAAVWRPRRTEKFRRRYYLLSPDEQAIAQPVPEVDGGLVIHMSPEGCEAYPVRCDEPIHTAFLYVLEAARWKFELEQRVIGSPLERQETVS